MLIKLLYYILIFPIKRKIKKINGWENIPKEGPALLVANHIDYLDGWLINLLLMHYNRRKALFISKSKYYTYWAKGTTIPLAEHNSKEALSKTLAHLKKGELVAIFPEGQRNPDRNLLKGKTGAARLALWSRCPVVPIGFIGPYYRNFITSCLFSLIRPKDVTINIGKPVDLSRYYDKEITYELLTNCTRAIMKEIGRLAGKGYLY